MKSVQVGKIKKHRLKVYDRTLNEKSSTWNRISNRRKSPTKEPRKMGCEYTGGRGGLRGNVPRGTFMPVRPNARIPHEERGIPLTPTKASLRGAKGGLACGRG